MVSSLKERATNYYDQVSKAITNFSSEYSFKEYEEVDKAIASRNFVHPKYGTVTMIPIGDMFNHNVPASLYYSWSTEENKEGIRYHAVRDIPQGEEIFITYGDENTNEYLLTHYGFVLPKNTAEMKVSIKTE